MTSNRTKGCLVALGGGCLILVIGAGVVLFFAVQLGLERAPVHEHQRAERDHGWAELQPEVALEDLSSEERQSYQDLVELEGAAALTALDRLIEVHPDCYNLYYDRAAVQRALGDLAAAISDYSVGIELRGDPDSSYFPFDESDVPPPPFVALLELAEVHEELGLTDDALAIARRSLAEDPQHPYRPLVYIGTLQCDLGRYAEALPNFERAIDCDDAWLFDSERTEARAGLERALRGLDRVRDF